MFFYFLDRIHKIFGSYSSVESTIVLQQANKGLVALRHYVESHNGRISDEVNNKK